MKRVLTLVSAILLCTLFAMSASAEMIGDEIILDMGPFFGANEEDAPMLKGDVNGDGYVTSADATVLASALATGAEDLTDAANVCDDDDVINIKDLIALMQQIYAAENPLSSKGILYNLAIPVADDNGDCFKTEHNGNEGLFVHVLTDSELLWIQLDKDAQADIYPSIEDTEKFDEAYLGKLCSAVKIENNKHKLTSLSYNELENGNYAGLNKDEHELENALDNEILYTEDGIKKITFSDGIASCFRDYTPSSLCNFNFTLTDDTIIILKNIKNKDTANEVVEYILFNNKDVFISYYESPLYNASIILQNNTDTSSEDALVIFAEAEDYTYTAPDYRIIADSDVNIDENDYYRNYYTVYNPFTGKKTELIAGTEYSNSYKTLSPAVAIGSVVELKDGKVDEKEAVLDTLDINSTSFLADFDANYKAGTAWIVEYSESDKILMLAPVGGCWNDAEDGLIESYQVDNNTAVSMIQYADTKNNNTFVQWGTMSLLTTADLTSASTAYRCFNTKVEGNNATYKTGYAKYIKTYVVTENETYLDEGELNKVIMVIVLIHPEETQTYLTTHTSKLHEECI